MSASNASGTRGLSVLEACERAVKFRTNHPFRSKLIIRTDLSIPIACIGYWRCISAWSGRPNNLHRPPPCVGNRGQNNGEHSGTHQNPRDATPALMRSRRYRMSWGQARDKWATPTKCAWYCEQLRCGFQVKCNRGSDAPGRPFIPPPTVEDVAMRRFSALYQIQTRASTADVAKL